MSTEGPKRRDLARHGVYLERDTWREMDAEAERLRCSTSEVVRRAWRVARAAVHAGEGRETKTA